MSTQTIERMTVEIEGDGEPVILIHGLGGTSNTFQPLLPAWSGRHRIIRPDLPGSGRSPHHDQPLSVGLFVETIVRMAKALGAEKAHFVGHSLGTIVCQHIAAEHPSMVRSLALFGPLMEPPEQARQAIRDRAAKARRDGMADIADAIVGASVSAESRQRNPAVAAFVRESLMRQCPEGYARTCEALAEARAADLGRIGCPVLLVTGEDDPVAPASVSRLMNDRLERSTVVILPRCGHWAPVERPAECLAVLKDFHGRANVAA